MGDLLENIGGGGGRGNAKIKATYLGENQYQRPLEDIAALLAAEANQQRAQRNLLFGGEGYGGSFQTQAQRDARARGETHNAQPYGGWGGYGSNNPAMTRPSGTPTQGAPPTSGTYPPTPWPPSGGGDVPDAPIRPPTTGGVRAPVTGTYAGEPSVTPRTPTGMILGREMSTNVATAAPAAPKKQSAMKQQLMATPGVAETYAKLKAAGAPEQVTSAALLEINKGIAAGLSPDQIAGHYMGKAQAYGGDWAKMSLAGHHANWKLTDDVVAGLKSGQDMSRTGWADSRWGSGAEGVQAAAQAPAPAGARVPAGARATVEAPAAMGYAASPSPEAAASSYEMPAAVVRATPPVEAPAVVNWGGPGAGNAGHPQWDYWKPTGTRVHPREGDYGGSDSGGGFGGEETGGGGERRPDAAWRPRNDPIKGRGDGEEGEGEGRGGAGVTGNVTGGGGQATPLAKMFTNWLRMKYPTGPPQDMDDAGMEAMVAEWWKSTGRKGTPPTLNEISRDVTNDDISEIEQWYSRASEDGARPSTFGEQGFNPTMVWETDPVTGKQTLVPRKASEAIDDPGYAQGDAWSTSPDWRPEEPIGGIYGAYKDLASGKQTDYENAILRNWQNRAEGPMSQTDADLLAGIKSYGKTPGRGENEAYGAYSDMIARGYSPEEQNAITQEGMKAARAGYETNRDAVLRNQARTNNSAGYAANMAKMARGFSETMGSQGRQNQIDFANEASRRKEAGASGMTNLAQIGNQRGATALGAQADFGREQARQKETAIGGMQSAAGYGRELQKQGLAGQHAIYQGQDPTAVWSQAAGILSKPRETYTETGNASGGI